MQLRAKGFLTNNDFLSDFSCGGCYEGISMAVKLEKPWLARDDWAAGKAMTIGGASPASRKQNGWRKR
jgi:hypothetical protein